MSMINIPLTDMISQWKGNLLQLDSEGKLYVAPPKETPKRSNIWINLESFPMTCRDCHFCRNIPKDGFFCMGIAPGEHIGSSSAVKPSWCPICLSPEPEKGSCRICKTRPAEVGGKICKHCDLEQAAYGNG